MYNERELARLSYRDLQILAAQHRVPGNIKKNAMIKVILAARRGDESEVTKLLDELQHTRKKRVKKVKGERKIAIKPASMRSTNQHQISNRYYAHQQQTSSYHCASNLQIATQEEISNADGEHTNLSNYEDVHEYLVRVQRDYHFNINNNNEFVGNQSIVDLRVNEQKTIVHQTLPLDLHRATGILLSSDHNVENATDKITYHHFLDSNDAMQTPILLKKMLQAPAGTNLNDIAGPDGVYRICSNNNDFGMNDFMDDSDTLTADSESNANDDNDNINEDYDSILHADRNPFVNVNQNLIDDHGVHELNAMNHNFLNDNVIYQSSTDTQQNYQKWVQEYNNRPLTYNIIDTEQDNGQILKAIYDANHYSTHECVNNAQINQVQYQTENNFSSLENDININHSTFTESSNSLSHYPMYNYQTDNNNAVIVNNNIQNNHGNIYNNHQLRSDDANSYYPQSYNAHHSETFNDIYPNSDANLSQQFHSNNIENLAGINNANVGNNERYSNNEYYSQNSQMNFNVNHNVNQEQMLINNQNQQYNKYCDSGDMGTNNVINNDDLESYFPRWKQSTITSAVGMSLENLLNIRKYNEWDKKKTDETLSVFCYSAPIVTPKQLIANANVCTQEKRFVAENRENLSLKMNSSQVYNDTAQGLKMATPKNDSNLHSINQMEIINNEQFSSNDKNFDGNYLNDINSDNTLRDVWAIDYSNIRCDIHAKSS